MGNCLGGNEDQPRPKESTRSSSNGGQEHDSERNRLLRGPTSQQSYGAPSSASGTAPTQPSPSAKPQASRSFVKPIGQFNFLDKKYSVTTPECGILVVDEVFKSVCERYDIAVTNREKIDEALTLFKQILELELDTPLEECFLTWKEFLVNPRFTVNCMEASGDVKDIRVRADDIPKERRKAQKHIRDLLDACHLFLQQREFLERNIMEDITKLNEYSRDLQSLADQASLNSSQKKHLHKTFPSGHSLVQSFPETIELFWRQTYSLMHEINTSVHVLDGMPGPDSADLR